MNSDVYRRLLLSSLQGAKIASGGREVIARCPSCGKEEHLYVSIPQDNNTPSKFNCFKCGYSGIVTPRILMEWDSYDPDVAIDLLNHNKNCNGKDKSYNNKTIKSYYIRNDIIDSKASRGKLDYINNRLGLQLSYHDLLNLKIVLNLYDVLNASYVQKLTRHKNICDQLNEYFMGFISIDNTTINMRRLVDEGIVYQGIDERYINYKIFDVNNNQKFYTIPTMIDMTQPINIHIAEGPFDILSIYKNVRREEPGIYSSCTGCNYLAVLMYFIETYKIPYCNIHIYADNDKSGSNEKMNKIASAIRPLRFPLYIHRNLYNGEKDFGVSSERIKEGVIQLL